MRDAARRIANYTARMTNAQLDPVIAAKAESMKTNFAAYAEEFVPKQEQVNALLSDLGIPTIQFLGYYAFANEIHHLSKVAAGDSAIEQASILVAKYVSLGLDPAPLIDIAAIWSIVVPPVV